MSGVGRITESWTLIVVVVMVIFAAEFAICCGVGGCCCCDCGWQCCCWGGLLLGSIETELFSPLWYISRIWFSCCSRNMRAVRSRSNAICSRSIIERCCSYSAQSSTKRSDISASQNSFAELNQWRKRLLVYFFYRLNRALSKTAF